MRAERVWRLPILCACVLVLAGCGMKGDLFLPGEEPAPEMAPWPGTMPDEPAADDEDEASGSGG